MYAKIYIQIIAHYSHLSVNTNNAILSIYLIN